MSKQKQNHYLLRPQTQQLVFISSPAVALSRHPHYTLTHSTSTGINKAMEVCIQRHFKKTLQFQEL